MWVSEEKSAVLITVHSVRLIHTRRDQWNMKHNNGKTAHTHIDVWLYKLAEAYSRVIFSHTRYNRKWWWFLWLMFAIILTQACLCVFQLNSNGLPPHLAFGLCCAKFKHFHNLLRPLWMCAIKKSPSNYSSSIHCWYFHIFSWLQLAGQLVRILIVTQLYIH